MSLPSSSSSSAAAAPSKPSIIDLNFIDCKGSPLICVSSDEDARILWSLGWYGKGSLSRGKPMCCFRKDPPKARSEAPSANQDSTSNTDGTQEDACGEVPPSKKVKEGELVLLTHPECFYLAFLSKHDGVSVTVGGKTRADCWNAFCGANPRFPLLMAAYVYFRGKGWAPRTGISHGVDFLLYKPLERHTHAEYSVIVTDCKAEDFSWARLLRTSRNMVSVAKALVVCRVSSGEVSTESPDCLDGVEIQTIVFSRWDPNKSR